MALPRSVTVEINYENAPAPIAFAEAFMAVYGILGKMAYIERGYEALGGEVIAAAITGGAAYILADIGIRYVYQTLKKASDRNNRGR